jgi:hypothetical protein
LAQPPAPTICIVTATYNRSRALALTIEAITRQSFREWELLVVGDACDDDTADVVARFDDARIRFHNLARNVGDQAGPNNFGWTMAQAPFVAFCNHDVIWLPHHLRMAYEALLTHRADVVFGTAAILGGDTPLPLRWPELRIALDGIPADGRWDPGLLNAGTVSASSLVMRREVLEAVNGWRLARECASEPSQDLLFRAWRSGARVRAIGALTSVTAPSGFRPQSYVGNTAPESEWLLAEIERPDVGAELAAMALETNDEHIARSDHRPHPLVRYAARWFARLGRDPRALWFRYARRMRRGEYVAGLRALRGLADPPPGLGAAAQIRYQESVRSCQASFGTTISFAAGAGGARHLARGWSRPDSGGVWADGASAELLFEFRHAPQAGVDLEFEFRVFEGDGHAKRTVRVSAKGDEVAQLVLARGVGWTRRLSFTPAHLNGRRLRIEFRFDDPESPRALGLSDDPRLLSIGLIAVGVVESAPAP